MRKTSTCSADIHQSEMVVGNLASSKQSSRLQNTCASFIVVVVALGGDKWYTSWYGLAFHHGIPHNKPSAQPQTIETVASLFLTRIDPWTQVFPLDDCRHTREGFVYTMRNTDFQLPCRRRTERHTKYIRKFHKGQAYVEARVGVTKQDSKRILVWDLRNEATWANETTQELEPKCAAWV